MNYQGHKTRSSWSRLWRVLFILSSAVSFLWRFPSKLAELDLWVHMLTLICYENPLLLFFIFLTIYQPYITMVKINYFWGTQSRRGKTVCFKSICLRYPTPTRKSIYLVSHLSLHKILSSCHNAQNAESS